MLQALEKEGVMPREQQRLPFKGRGCLGEARKEDDSDPRKVFVQLFLKY